MSSGDPLLSVNGRVSLERLKERDHAFADVVRNSLHWHVYTYTVHEGVPEAMSVIQHAKTLGVGATTRA